MQFLFIRLQKHHFYYSFKPGYFDPKQMKILCTWYVYIIIMFKGKRDGDFTKTNMK